MAPSRHNRSSTPRLLKAGLGVLLEVALNRVGDVVGDHGAGEAERLGVDGELDRFVGPEEYGGVPEIHGAAFRTSDRHSLPAGWMARRGGRRRVKRDGDSTLGWW